ncbi:MAG: multiheme c-type cytochrome [Halopseudomonas sp.]
MLSRFAILTLLLCSCLIHAEQSPNQHIGSPACVSCHLQQGDQWQGSPHQRAMQSADQTTVLGQFDGQTLDHFGTRYRFYQRAKQFFIDADNTSGNITAFEIRYTFGVYPLQQYLVEQPGGRLQALPVAWDARPQPEGGQRWFHLYPNEAIDHNDELHWTGANQNWNFMCADCHSTGLDKGYDLDSDSFDTQWSEISVGCEACHGPGGNHQQWAKQGDSARQQDPSMGLALRLSKHDAEHWRFKPGTNTATRNTDERTDHTETERCASCHARRLAQAIDQPGAPLADHLSLSLLESRLYHSDGQIKDEVFEYGSFIQSKMYHQGVRCSDCHNSHDQTLRAPGAAVCSQCHRAAYFASPEHSHHTPASQPSSTSTPARLQPDCLDCHMPSSTYMVVDPRRDHSLRVPRPDLTVSLGTPNACQSCHADRPDDWAADSVRQWLGRDAVGFQRFAAALDAGSKGTLDAEQQLLALAASTQQPAIARASALQRLVPLYRWQDTSTLLNALKDPDPIVRKAAIGVVETLPVEQRSEWLLALLSDPVRSVRIEAARLLAAVPEAALAAKWRKPRKQALDEFIQAQHFNAERPESHLNLGNLYRDQATLDPAKLDLAEQAYRQAIKLNPRFSPAWTNLADLYRAKGQEQRSLELLLQGLQNTPDNPALLMAQGFALIRQQQQPQALQSFAKAVANAPDNSRYHYIYGVALNSTPQQAKAVEQFEKSRALFPANPDAITALLDNALRGKDYPKAYRYATELQQLTPWNEQLQQLLQQLNAYKG